MIKGKNKSLSTMKTLNKTMVHSPEQKGINGTSGIEIISKLSIIDEEYTLQLDIRNSST